jgi:precorrin-6Y C5,15-methyltransferase (decarboxylating)
MTKSAHPWITVQGLTEDGLAGLSKDVMAQINAADLIIGPDRMIGDIKSAAGFSGEAKSWPTPFLEIVPLLESYRGRPVMILATGDPLWFGAASTLVRYFNNSDMTITPQPSGFQWAASRMGWPLQSTSCLTVHGRPHETVLKHLGPGHRIFVFAHDASSPGIIAGLLVGAGYGDAVMTVLGHIGGAGETRDQMPAKEWIAAMPATPDFSVIAVACPDYVPRYLPVTPGLPDDAFDSDGKLTKAELRAVALAKLKPQRGGMLWDLGCGSGSIGIEWMRAAPHARAIGFECRQDRLKMAEDNARSLGAPEWQGRCVDFGDDPAGVLSDCPDPDAAFIGGGLTHDLVGAVLARLKDGGRLVANTVTLESETLLTRLWESYGGRLCRINVARAEPVGSMHGWRPLMPVTQWAFEKHPASQAGKGEG